MNFLVILFAGMLFVHMTPGLSAQAQADANRPLAASALTENQLFDAQRRDPMALLQELFEEKKMLVLGYPDHRHDGYHRVLNKLLERVGHDPRLKFIISERDAYFKTIFEELSIAKFDEAALLQKLSEEQQVMLCTTGGGEGHLDFTTLLPQIRRLNARRPATSPLRLTAADGGVYGMMRTYPREARTNALFTKAIWNGLAPSEKVIVTYNLGHVTKKLQMEQWLEKFLRQHPGAEAQIAVVPIEYLTDPGGTYHPAHLKFTQRQAARYPGQPWGVRLAPFRGVATERGKEVFDASSTHGRISSQTNATLPEMYDAVIWWSEGSKEYEPRPVSLPLMCPPKRISPITQRVWDTWKTPAVSDSLYILSHDTTGTR